MKPHLLHFDDVVVVVVVVVAIHKPEIIGNEISVMLEGGKDEVKKVNTLYFFHSHPSSLSRRLYLENNHSLYNADNHFYPFPNHKYFQVKSSVCQTQTTLWTAKARKSADFL